MTVLHVGQVPLIAGLPFFMVYGPGLPISRLSLHFTQYPIVITSLGLRFYYRELVEFFSPIGKSPISIFMLQNNFFRTGHFFTNSGINYSNFLNNNHIFDLDYFVKI